MLSASLMVLASLASSQSSSLELPEKAFHALIDRTDLDAQLVSLDAQHISMAPVLHLLTRKAAKATALTAVAVQLLCSIIAKVPMSAQHSAVVVQDLVRCMSAADGVAADRRDNLIEILRCGG